MRLRGWQVIALLVFVLTACRTTGAVVKELDFDGEIAKIAAKIGKREATAVSYFYDRTTGNITELGNRWRDRTEAALLKKEVLVKTRKELGLLIDDVESFGTGRDEAEIWRQAGAQVLVTGTYRIVKSTASGQATRIFLRIKALRAANVIGSFDWQDDLAPDWARLESTVRGNVYKNEIRRCCVPGGGDIPNLSARLDRQPPCYPPGTDGKISVTTEQGVYIYLLNLSADHTVTLLYPNKKIPEQPLLSARFEFPPPVFDKTLKMVFNPIKENEINQEVVKVIASRHPLDFSFLPVPINRPYLGAEGGDIKKMLEVLRNASDWREVTLNYAVGNECR